MKILYSKSGDPSSLRTYVDHETNRMDFDREEAEQIARRITARTGYARVLFGSTTVAEYGEDPRHI